MTAITTLKVKCHHFDTILSLAARYGNSGTKMALTSVEIVESALFNCFTSSGTIPTAITLVFGLHAAYERPIWILQTTCDHLGPILLEARICNHMHSKMWDEITYKSIPKLHRCRGGCEIKSMSARLCATLAKRGNQHFRPGAAPPQWPRHDPLDLSYQRPKIKHPHSLLQKLDIK